MNYLTNLRQALDLYRSMGGGRGQGTNHRYSDAQNPSGEIVPGLLWAQDAAQRMGRQEEDYFAPQGQGNSLAPFVRPEGFDEQRPEMVPRELIPPRKIDRNTSMRGRADNYLARLLRRG